jgi:hypothetical protein
MVFHSMNRLTETVTKIPTPFRNVHLHMSWDLKDKPEAAGSSISHQQRDMDSDIAKALDALSGCLNRPAFLRNPGLLKQIVDGWHGAIEAGP